MYRVIFVGLHNKPHLTPLCSSTKTGKIIDKIIKVTGIVSPIKSNLYDVEYYPKPDEWDELIAQWQEKYQPTKTDVIVALGKHVSDTFKTCFPYLKTVCLAHPAQRAGKLQGNDYIMDASSKIRTMMLKIAFPGLIKN